MTGRVASNSALTRAERSVDARQTEYLLAILAELRKTNFLLERISGVEIESEAFNGRD